MNEGTGVLFVFLPVDDAPPIDAAAAMALREEDGPYVV